MNFRLFRSLLSHVCFIGLILTACATAPNCSSTLSIGSPCQGFISPNTYNFYSLPVSSANPNAPIAVFLAPMYGDPDLVGSLEPNPTKESATWVSTSAFGDGLILGTNLLTGPNLYLSVFGASPYAGASADSMYTITAFQPSVTIVSLAEGYPQLGIVYTGDLSYFSFSLVDNTAFTISVTQITPGDADIYVSLTDPNPSPNSFTWSSRSAGADYVRILPNDANFRPNSVYHISIFGFQGCEFSLLATRDSQTPMLMDHVAVTSALSAGEYLNFKMHLESKLDVVFVVVPLTYSDPDLYISTVPEPTADSYMWKSTNFGQDYVEIAMGDPNYKQPSDYYASIYGYTDTVFTILATSYGESQLLQEGVPSFGNTSQTQPVFFRYFHNSISDLSFGVTPAAGSGGCSPYMFISPISTQPYGEPGKFQFSCTTNQGCYITIPSDQTAPGYYYYVGVYPGGPNPGPWCTFTIVASSGAAPINLLDGVPIASSVGEQQYAYFTFQLGQAQSTSTLTIAVGQISGDPDVYVSTTNPRPTADGYTWKQTTAGSGAVHIQPSDPNFVVGTYFVGVYGFSATQFSVVAYTQNAIIQLTDSVAVSGVIEQDCYRYYSFTMQMNGRLYVSLQILNSDGDADLYVSIPGSNNPTPNADNYDYRSTRFGGDYIIKQNQQPGTYHIGVYGASNDITTFTIYATEDDILLLGGSYITDTLPAGEYNYYYFWPTLGNSTNQLTISLSSYLGFTSMFLNLNPSRPNATFNSYSNSNWPGNQIVVPTDALDSKTTPATWSLGVYASTDAVYQLAIQTGPISLQSGLPVYGAVAYSAYNHYTVNLGSQNAQMVSISIFSGAVTMFASTRLSNINATNFNPDLDYLAQGFGNLVINVPPQANQNSSILYVSIYGLADSYYLPDNPNGTAVYEILTYSINDTISIPSDIPISATLNMNQSLHLQSLVPQNAGIFIARIDSCSNTQPPTFSINTTTNGGGSIPSTSTQFSQVVTLNAPNPTGVLYSMKVDPPLVPNTQFSIFASASSLRPVPAGSGYLIAQLNPTTQTLTLTLGPALSASQYQPLQYRVYSHSVNLPTDLTNLAFNFHTPCAVKSLGHALTEWTPLTPSFDGDIEINNVRSQFDTAGLYAVNVLVQNSLGLRAAYAPVVVAQTPLVLTPLVRHYGSVPKGFSRYFQYTAPCGTDVTFTLGTTFGDPNLYVSTAVSNTRPGPWMYTWSSTGVGSDTITILASNPAYTCSSPFYVGVYGAQDSYYSVLVYTSNSTIALADSIPVSGTVSHNSYQYYSFSLPTVNRLYISLNVLTAGGDANLYVAKPSSLNPRPTKYTYDYRSISFGGDTLDLADQEPGTYFIGVYGATPGSVSFVIFANQDNPIIPDNLFLSDTAPASGQNFYHISIPFDFAASSVSLSVTLYSGVGSTLALNTNPLQPTTASAANFTVSGWPGQVITVPSYNPAFVVGTWTAGVFAPLQNSISYQIAVTSKNAKLVSGVPMFGSVQGTQCSYYQTSITASPAQDQIVSVTVYSGVVTLCASLTASQPNPSSNTCPYKSSYTSFLFLRVPASQISTPSNLYVSVCGVGPLSKASFVLTTYPISGSAVTLGDSQPSYTQLAANQPLSFISQVPPGQTPSPPSFFARLDSCGDVLPPAFYVNSSTGSLLYSRHYGWSNSLKIGSPDSGIWTSNVNPISNSQFTFYTTSSATFMPPTVGNSGQITYVVQGPQSIQFTFAPATSPGGGSGSSVQYKLYYRPLNQQYDLVAKNLQTACALELNASPLTDWISPAPDLQGLIQVPITTLDTSGVYGINIVVKNSLGLMDAYTPIVTQPVSLPLSDGVPVIETVGANLYHYFQYTVPGDNDLTIALAVLYGNADLYISTSSTRPTPGTAMWSSSDTGSDVITITTSDPNYTSKSPFYISVYSTSECSFTIVAYASNASVGLLDGIPVQGFVNEGKFTYYSFNMNGQGRLYINAAVLTSGADVDLYLSLPSSNNPKPTMLDYDFASNGLAGNYLLLEDAGPGVYYVGVYGNMANSVFVITATEDDPIIPDNLYLTMTATPQDPAFFFINMPPVPTYTHLTITLTPFSGPGFTSLFLNTFSERPNVRFANFTASGWPGDRIEINMADIPQPLNPVWSIGVYSTSTSLFQISVTTGTARLANGVPTFASVAPDTPQLYSIQFFSQQQEASTHSQQSRRREGLSVQGTTATDQLISVKVFSGQVTIYASQHSTTPNASNFNPQTDWISTSTPNSASDSASAPIDHLIRIPGSQLLMSNLYVSVFAAQSGVGKDESASYSILSYSYGMSLTLPIDQPIYTSLQSSQHSLFQTQIPPETPDLFRAQVFSCDNNLAPNLWLNTSSGVIFSGWSPENSGGFVQEVVVKNGLVSSGAYQVRVSAEEDSDTLFLVYATTTTGIVRPEPGDSGLLTVTSDPTHGRITFEFSPASIGQNYGPVSYQVFYFPKALSGESQAASINMNTACSVVNQGQPLTPSWVPYSPSQQEGGRIQIEVDSPSENGKDVFLFNVVAMSSVGLKMAYAPIVFVPPQRAHPLSGGSIFLIIISVLFVVYISVGFLIGLKRGKKGMEAFPNVQMWRAFWSLVEDGAKFAYLTLRKCTRRKPKYSRVGMLDTDPEAEDYTSIPRDNSRVKGLKKVFGKVKKFKGQYGSLASPVNVEQAEELEMNSGEDTEAGGSSILKTPSGTAAAAQQPATTTRFKLDDDETGLESVHSQIQAKPFRLFQ